MLVQDLHVPPFVERGTGVVILDALPIASLVAALPTIFLTWKQRRVADTVRFPLDTELLSMPTQALLRRLFTPSPSS